jgi:hypothetical protein
MEPEHPAGRSRWIVALLLALALGATLGAIGATLGAIAPHARAVPVGVIIRYQPLITITTSPASARLRKPINVSGVVRPVETVGEFVTLSVQRKTPKGKWAQVKSAQLPVQFTAPTYWTGPFNIEIAFPNAASTTRWQGQVMYERTYTNLDFHYADYEMISATGVCTEAGSGGSGTRSFSTTYFSETSLWDAGTIRWYFADSTGAPGGLGGIAGDSYEGSASHDMIGLSTRTWDDGTVEQDPNSEVYISGEIWPLSDPTGLPRPVLDPDLQMLGSRVRTLHGYTETVDWNLHQSQPDLPVLAERGGTYSWQYTPTKKGVYRLRTAMAQTADHYACQTPWRTVTVK